MKSKVMSKLAQEVTAEIGREFSDCMEDCKMGRLSYDVKGIIIRNILKIMDTWNPRLNYSIRCEVLDWVQENFGICM